MKTKITTIILLAMLSSNVIDSFAIAEESEIKSARQLASAIVASLRMESEESFTSLFPSIGEFHKLMESSGAYGAFLNEAQNDFAAEYTRSLLPAVAASLTSLVDEGKRKEIDWQNIVLIDVEMTLANEHSMTIVIASGDREYKILCEKLILVDGHLRVSQYVKLI